METEFTRARGAALDQIRQKHGGANQVPLMQKTESVYSRRFVFGYMDMETQRSHDMALDRAYGNSI
jgi:hypothetical protein